jgi:histone H3/H4
MKTGRPRKNGDPERPFGTLADVGISKRQSTLWQKMAQIPEAEFERMLKEGGPQTTAGIIRRWYGARERRLASLERMAMELRAAGWTVQPPGYTQDFRVTLDGQLLSDDP